MILILLKTMKQRLVNISITFIKIIILGRHLVDSGIVDPIWYDIVDGEKVYKRFAGIN